MSPARFPEMGQLADGLTSVFCGVEAGSSQVTVLERRPNVHASTFDSEVIRGKLPRGPEVTVLCKYGPLASACSHGHRGGVPYEVQVYRQVLQPSAVTTAAFHGSFQDTARGRAALVLEYLGPLPRVSRALDPCAMSLAARWLAQFHSAGARMVESGSTACLTRYDDSYYLQWARNVESFASDLHTRYPWLRPVCRRFASLIPHLLRIPQTTIHGEYYPNNILYREGIIYPVDWESAAIGPGAVDFCSLTEGWPVAVVRKCRREYERVRWPGGAPDWFGPALAAANCYWHLRWLGDQEEWTRDESMSGRFEQLYRAAKALSLV